MDSAGNPEFRFNAFEIEPSMEKFENVSIIPVIDIGSPSAGDGFVKKNMSDN